MQRIGVLFVCLGNICRSPTAHGIFQQKVQDAGFAELIDVDSAGTAAFHIGKAPDHRSVSAAGKRGYDLSRLRARQALAEDFHRYDYILAMDEHNLSSLRAIQPPDPRAQLSLFLDYAPDQPFREVPDPYYGGSRGFEVVLDLIEAAADGLLSDIQQRLHG
ncbi:low molecular weight protein-tyrosine-phosphatase [Motiliproteus sediminis]|uniref:low molecular weight protein-tyrosine-phosphatase n=1 Tax=Motiliproteus sediminis TaxID=1468178 RepID=UPI001AF0073B|nr:low molecular weight protein-tyrosine-phosphatase [Motiliproteus sediminis]